MKKKERKKKTCLRTHTHTSFRIGLWIIVVVCRFVCLSTINFSLLIETQNAHFSSNHYRIQYTEDDTLVLVCFY